MTRSDSILALIHSDVGQLNIISAGGAKYYVIFTDDFSRAYWIYTMKEKNQVLSKFKIFKAMVEKETK